MTMWILAILGVPLTASAGAPVAELAVGDQFPPLKGEFLSGRTAVLPQAASGRVALLMLGFTYDSRFQVEAWAKRFRQDFGTKPGVTFFEIPMIGGMARMGKWFIDGGMRRGTPKADHANVITVYGGTDAWKQRVGFNDPTAAYLVLIDQRGSVAWRTAGGLDEQRYSALSSEVSRLLSAD
jgi:hypothetical protein